MSANGISNTPEPIGWRPSSYVLSKLHLVYHIPHLCRVTVQMFSGVKIWYSCIKDVNISNVQWSLKFTGVYQSTAECSLTNVHINNVAWLALINALLNRGSILKFGPINKGEHKPISPIFPEPPNPFAAPFPDPHCWPEISILGSIEIKFLTNDVG